MSACDKLSFNDITPAVWQRAIAAAAEYGVAVTANAGDGTARGFTVAWNYEPVAQTVSLQCTDSPFWAPCGVINNKLTEVVNACIAGTDAPPSA